jgi:hypothetical protein
MKTLQRRRQPQRQRALTDARPLRLRAELPVVTSPLASLCATTAAHDLLVANPRPDLTWDLQTLRMMEVYG